MEKDCATTHQDLEGAAVSSLIPRLARTHRSHVYEPLRQLGLAPGQELMLMRLWHSGPQKQSALAAMLGVANPTIAKMVTRLEQAGFVARQKPPGDARAVLVTLTEAGQALRPKVETIWEELENRTVRALSADERQTLNDLLVKLIIDLESDH